MPASFFAPLSASFYRIEYRRKIIILALQYHFDGMQKLLMYLPLCAKIKSSLSDERSEEFELFILSLSTKSNTLVTCIQGDDTTKPK